MRNIRAGAITPTDDSPENLKATTQDKDNQLSAIQYLKQLQIETWEKEYPNIPAHFHPKPTFEDQTTNGLTRCIISFLKLSGNQAERISSEGRVIDARRTVTDIIGRQRTIGSIRRVFSTAQRGTADISATIAGRSVKVEVKNINTGDKQSPAQKEYEKQITAAGGLYVIARSFEQFYSWYVSTFGGRNE
jgi:hypothetical protein